MDPSAAFLWPFSHQRHIGTSVIRDGRYVRDISSYAVRISMVQLGSWHLGVVVVVGTEQK